MTTTSTGSAHRTRRAARITSSVTVATSATPGAAPATVAAVCRPYGSSPAFRPTSVATPSRVGTHGSSGRPVTISLRPSRIASRSSTAITARMARANCIRTT